MSQATTQTTPPAPAVTGKGLQDWIEVFKAGTHVDSKGNEHTFGTADLDSMVANVALGKTPAVLGHPKHDDPAYAWATLRRDGESLFAKFEDINPAFEQGVISGAYRNRSLALVPVKGGGWRVRHVGWLGAKLPAIDGLKPVEFSADDDEEATVITFAAADEAVREVAWALDSMARLVRGVRDHLIEKEGVEVADRVLPSYSIDSLQSSAQSVRTALSRAVPVSAFSTNEGGDMAFTQADIDKARDDARQEAELQYSAQGQELAELRAQRASSKVDTLINGWKVGQKFFPYEMAGLREFMLAIDSASPAEFTFSAGDNQDVKKSPLAWFSAHIDARKPVVNLGRDTRIDGDNPTPTSNDPTVIAQKAQEYMAAQSEKGITVSYVDAVMKFSPPIA